MTVFDFCTRVARLRPSFAIHWQERLKGPHLLDDESLRTWLATFPDAADRHGTTLLQALEQVTAQNIANKQERIARKK